MAVLRSATSDVPLVSVLEASGEFLCLSGPTVR